MREKFDAAMSAVMQCREALLATTEVEIMAREDLKYREMVLLAALPEHTLINGKNAETRAAQLRDLTKDQRESLAGAERSKRLAVLRLEVALDARRNLESILKIDELEKI
ncbi:MAG: hypothetical protein WC343_10435 [Bacilli bacterium]|jgi:hypothetical protein